MRPMRTRPVVQALLAVAGLVLGVLAYQVQIDNLPDPLTTPLETVRIKPKKTDISVQLVALVWQAETARLSS